MGLCGKVDQERELSKKLSKDLLAGKKNGPRKLLLLGPGEAGKSTLFKQVKRIYDDGFDKATLESYKAAVFANIIEGIKILITEGRRQEAEWTDQGVELSRDLMQFSLNQVVTPEIADQIHFLWTQEPAIRQALDSRSFPLGDSVPYFLDSVHRVSQPSYSPTEEDVIHVRVRTSGISELAFTMNNTPFVIFDVGGQRGERRKWIHCFEGVHAVLFVTAISEYDRVMAEDEAKNRLIDALELFKSIVNLQVFLNTSIILFFNKSDIFREKMRLKVGDLTNVFPDYSGGHDADTAIEFLKEKFVSTRDNEDQDVYVHVTCATNKTNVQFVLDAVRSIVIKYHISNSGFT